MTGIEIVKALLAAAEAGDFDKAAGMLTDDMVFAGTRAEAHQQARVHWYTVCDAGRDSRLEVRRLGFQGGREPGQDGDAHQRYANPGIEAAAARHAARPCHGEALLSLPAEPATLTIKDGKVPASRPPLSLAQA